MTIPSLWIQDICSDVKSLNITYTNFYLDQQSYGYILYVSQININTNNIYFAKLDPDGLIIFNHQFPTFNTNINTLRPEINVDLQGNIYLMYVSYDMLKKNQLIILLKLDSLGQRLWIKYHTQVDHVPHLLLRNNTPLVYHDYIDDNHNHHLCIDEFNQSHNLTQLSVNVPMCIPVKIQSNDDIYIILNKTTLFKMDAYGKISWLCLVTDKKILNEASLLIDEQFIYVIFLTNKKLHIHQFDKNGIIIKKIHHSEINLETSAIQAIITDNHDIIVSYISADMILHYYRFHQDSGLFENYCENIQIPQIILMLNHEGYVYLMLQQLNKITCVKMDFPNNKRVSN